MYHVVHASAGYSIVDEDGTVVSSTLDEKKAYAQAKARNEGRYEEGGSIMIPATITRGR